MQIKYEWIYFVHKLYMHIVSGRKAETIFYSVKKTTIFIGSSKARPRFQTDLKLNRCVSG